MSHFGVVVRDATERAFAASRDSASIDLSVTGIHVRISCTDTSLLAAFSNALVHHSIPRSVDADSCEPISNIRIWSSQATGVPRPRMPEDIRQRVVDRRAILAVGDDFQMDFDPTGRMLTVMDPLSGSVDVCINDLAQLPQWERAAPLRSAMGWILRRHDRHLIHAAAVANSGGAALLLGPGGAGKSSASLRCRQSGMGFLGDDICVIGSHEDSTPYVANIYGTAKALWADHGRFPDLDPFLVTDPTIGAYKAVYAVNEMPNSQIVKQSDLRSLILLDRDHPVGWTESVDPAKVVALVASTTSSFLAGSGRPMLTALSEVARQLPVTRLSVGEDPAEVASLVSAAIDSTPTRTHEFYAH